MSEPHCRAMATLDAFAAENFEIIEGLRTVTAADDVLYGMGLGSTQWKEICRDHELQRYLRVNDANREVYFLAYVAAQFVGEECVHLSLAIGEKDKICILEGCSEADRPTDYNATRDIGLRLTNALSASLLEKVNVDTAALLCLSRLIPGIPHGNPKEDKGLHMSLFNKVPNGSAPTAASVKELQKMFERGVALQLDLDDLKIVKGSRHNDMATGGMYYLACGMSTNLSTLCTLIKERFADSIKGFAPHVSLELWGVAGCQHPQQKLGRGSDLKYWFCDFLRWGMDAGVFEKCLDAHGKFDLARYMYVRTHDKLNDFTDADKAKVGGTIELMNGFKFVAIGEFIEAVDGYTGFGSIRAEQRFHDKDSALYKFFKDAPSHPGVDCAQTRIKNCATAAGKGPRWFPGTEFSLPTPEVQSHIQKYITDFQRG